DEPGGPDGMKVDTEGNVYCTGSGGIHVMNPAGKLIGRIKLHPVTNFAWGDDDWRTLYITGRSDQRPPRARTDVYRVRLGIAGIPVPACPPAGDQQRRAPMATASAPTGLKWEFERVAGPFDGATDGLAWDGETLLFTVRKLPVDARENRILRYDPRNS